MIAPLLVAGLKKQLVSAKERLVSVSKHLGLGEQLDAIIKDAVFQFYILLLCDAWFQFLRFGSVPCSIAWALYFHGRSPYAWAWLVFAKGFYPLDAWWQYAPFCLQDFRRCMVVVPNVRTLCGTALESLVKAVQKDGVRTLKSFEEQPIRLVFEPPESFDGEFYVKSLGQNGTVMRKSKMNRGKVVCGYIFPQDMPGPGSLAEEPCMFERKDNHRSTALVRLWAEPQHKPADPFELMAIGTHTQSIQEYQKELEQALKKVAQQSPSSGEDMKGALELCRNNTFVIAQAAEDFRTALSRHRELESFIMDGKLSLCIRREKRSNNFAAIQASPENILKILRKNALMARHYFRVEPHGSLCVANMGCLCWAEDITIGGEREHVLYIRTGRMYCFANIQELNEFAGLGGKNAKCFQEQYSLMYGSCEDYKLELLLLRKLGSGSEGTVHMVKVMDLKPFQGAWIVFCCSKSWI